MSKAKASATFLASYRADQERAQRAADLARAVVEKAVRDTGTFVHVITARAKTYASLRGKLRRKNYSDPSAELTDLIGVRVVTYYRDAVDPIVDVLQRKFDINKHKSVDKRLSLGLRDFGYRSVHLIARLKRSQVLTKDHEFIRENWFEIQIRSILEHTWAEIEHEVVYKSGIDYGDEFLRRLASLAGTLELLDTEFLQLRSEKSALIRAYVTRYENGKDFSRSFDVARLLAFLEFARPEGLSWRQASENGTPFSEGFDTACLAALKAVGLSTPASLRKQLASRPFAPAVRGFASSQGVAPAETSHLAIAMIAAAIRAPQVVVDSFPEFLDDPAIYRLIQRRIQRL